MVGLEGSRWATWERRQGESLGDADQGSEGTMQSLGGPTQGHGGETPLPEVL